MKVIVTIVEKIKSEAHIDIPNGLSESAIRQHITDLYNSGEMSTDLNIYQVDFESISATVVSSQLLDQELTHDKNSAPRSQKSE